MNSETLKHSALPSLLVLPLIMEEWLSSSPHPTLICDPQLRVLWHSASLAKMLDNLTCLRLERDYLAFSEKRAQSALSQFIQSADATTTVIPLEAGEQAGHHLLQCRRLQVTADVTAFGLRILTDMGFRESAVLHFDEYFNLTRQETFICRELLRGNTVQEIVAETGKSADTIRCQIRNIYEKREMKSREAMFAKLRLFLFD